MPRRRRNRNPCWWNDDEKDASPCSNTQVDILNHLCGELLEMLCSSSGTHEQGLRHAVLANRAKGVKLSNKLCSKLYKLESARKSIEHMTSAFAKNLAEEVRAELASYRTSHMEDIVFKDDPWKRFYENEEGDNYLGKKYETTTHKCNEDAEFYIGEEDHGESTTTASVADDALDKEMVTYSEPRAPFMQDRAHGFEYAYRYVLMESIHAFSQCEYIVNQVLEGSHSSRNDTPDEDKILESCELSETVGDYECIDQVASAIEQVQDLIDKFVLVDLDILKRNLVDEGYDFEYDRWVLDLHSGFRCDLLKDNDSFCVYSVSVEGSDICKDGDFVVAVRLPSEVIPIINDDRHNIDGINTNSVLDNIVAHRLTSTNVCLESFVSNGELQPVMGMDKMRIRAFALPAEPDYGEYEDGDESSDSEPT